MKAYLDDFNIITIILKNDLYYEKFILDGKEINIIEKQELEDSNKYICSFDFDIDLHKDHYVNDCLLLVGRIIKSDRFDELFHYDGPLGCHYNKNKSIFRIYSPIAKQMILVLDRKYKMIYKEKGLWELSVNGDFVNHKYHYLVRINKKFKKTLDPYGYLADNKFNYVVDMDSLYQFKYARPKAADKKIIYEAHIRDFTIKLDSNKKGTYLGFVEDLKDRYKNDVGINYVANMGFSHIQLMPIQMFGGINDGKYNWGYNPLHYFVNSEYYMEKNRINELREMVDIIHNKGLRVVIDVVYNHVYSRRDFPYSILLPGYSFRYDEKGFITNISGCGNDLASKRIMIKKLIIDSIMHIYKTYNIDGLRFDLMGLLDVNLMKEIRSYFPSDFLIYGEGWDMPSTLKEENRATINNNNRMSNILLFNDSFRNIVRGDNWENTSGFAFGDKKDIKNLLLGSPDIFDNVEKSINYVECHDNFTFYDKMISIGKNDKDYQKLANALVVLAKGTPFIHCGQEFLRTKKGVENSYNSKDDINGVNWELMIENMDMVNELKGLIKLRKTLNYDNVVVNDIGSMVRMIFDDCIIYFKNDNNEVSVENTIIDKIGVYIFKEGKQWSLMD